MDVVRIELTRPDQIIIGLFVVAVLALGFSARAGSGVLGFLSAGRLLTLPAFVATLVCTWYGGILGIAESVSFYGVGAWLLIGVPYYVFGALYAAYMARRVRTEDALSIPDRLLATGGRGPAVMAGGLLFLLGIPAAHILMLAVLMVAIFGGGLVPAIVVCTLIVGALTYKGGLMADVRVSLLAFVLMFTGFGIASGQALSTGALTGFWNDAMLKPANWAGNQGPIGILSFFLLGAWTFADPGFHQRVASARDTETAERGVWVSVLCWMVFDFLSITSALYALSIYSQLPDPSTVPGLMLFPLLANSGLEPGWRGMFVVGMAGTILSAGVGYALVSGASLGRDLIAKFRQNEDDATQVKWMRRGVILALVAAAALAASLQSVVAIWYLWAGAIVGALLVPTALAYLRPQAWTGRAQLAALIAGSVVGFGLLIFGQMKGDPYVTVQMGPEAVGLGTLVPALVASSLAGFVANRRT